MYKLCEECWDKADRGLGTKGIRSILNGKCTYCVPRAQWNFKLKLESPVANFNFDQEHFQSYMVDCIKGYLLQYSLDAVYADQSAYPRVEIRPTLKVLFTKCAGEKTYRIAKKLKIKKKN